MAKAKCFKCGGTASGETFEEASAKINHGAARSHGVICGGNIGIIKEIVDESFTKVVEKPKPKSKPKKQKKPKKEKVEKVKEEIPIDDDVIISDDFTKYP